VCGGEIWKRSPGGNTKNQDPTAEPEHRQESSLEPDGDQVYIGESGGDQPRHGEGTGHAASRSSGGVRGGVGAHEASKKAHEASKKAGHEDLLQEALGGGCRGRRTEFEV